MDCLFCDIAAGKKGVKFICEDDKLVAFDDIHPKAPQHKLIIPKKHIATLNELEDNALGGHMLLTARRIAQDLGFAEDGYRVLINCNQNGGQEVYHIHLHLLGGRQMHWPPG